MQLRPPSSTLLLLFLGLHVPRTKAAVPSFDLCAALLKVLKAASEQGVTISKVLTTHKHHDHAGGNNAMASEIAGLEIVGGEKDRVQGANVTVKDGDIVSVGGITVQCMHTAG